MKLLIKQFPPISRHIIPLRSKYCSQDHVLKHPQSILLILLVILLILLLLLQLPPHILVHSKPNKIYSIKQ
jgi:hypothetical protein